MLFLFSTISAMTLEPSSPRASSPSGTPKKGGRSSICWPPNPRLKPIRPSDCEPLVAALKTGDKKDGLMHFSKHENRGYKLPHVMSWGTCVIVMNFVKSGEVGPEEEDDSTFTALAELVETVITFCVVWPGSDGYGGGFLFGEHDRMLVYVEGRVPPATGERKKDYSTTSLLRPITKPPRKNKEPLKFQPPPSSQGSRSYVHDTPQGIVIELPFSEKQVEELQRQVDLLALQEKSHTPHQPKSVLS